MAKQLKLITEFFDSVNVTKDKDGALFIEGVFASAEMKNKNERIYKRQTLEREIKKLQESVDKKNLWGELNHPSCFSETAQILTSEGFKFIKDISEDEKVLTLNKESGVIETKEITKKVVFPYLGKMIRLNGRNVDTLVTPEHRFIVYDKNNNSKFVTAQEILERQNQSYFGKHRVPRTGVWNEGVETDTITISGISEPSKYYGNAWKEMLKNDCEINSQTFMAFLGIYLAEGCITKNNRNRINIYQNVGEKEAAIWDILQTFPEEMKWSRIETNEKVVFSLSDARLANVLKPLGNCYEKYIPVEYKNMEASLLQELLYWYGIGDGRNVFDRQDGYQNVFTTSERLILDLQEILLKAGGCGNISTIITDADYSFAGRTIKAANKVPLYVLNIATTQNFYLTGRFLSVTEEDFEGTVYCVQVPNETFYVNDNGKCFWSGNCPDINLERAAILIEKLEWKGDNVVGRAKVLDTPMGKIAKTLIKEGMIGISSRGLGSVDESGYVNDGSFNLLTFDLVSNPSNHPSWVKGVYEGATFNSNGVEDSGDLSEQEAKKAYKNYILSELKKLF